MDKIPPRPPDAPSLTVYWRRRVIALSLGIALLALFAWTVNGTLSSGAAAGQAATGNGSHRGGASASPLAGSLVSPAAQGRTAQGATSSHSLAARGQSPYSRHSTGPAAGRPRSPARATAPPAAPGTAPPGWAKAAACPAADVTLSLFTPRYWYKRGQLPELAVVAVSTVSHPCRFNLGGRYLSVRIAGARGAVWNSSDCVRGRGSRKTLLAKGVPSVAWRSWNRKASSPGCHFSRVPVRLGTYTVKAEAGQLRSKTVVIVLGGPGVAVP